MTSKREVMSLSDRILVMFEGRVVAEFEGGSVSEEELGYYMTAGGKAAKSMATASGSATHEGQND